MRSPNLLFGQSCLCTEFDLQRLTEYGQRSKSRDAVQARLDVEERRRSRRCGVPGRPCRSAAVCLFVPLGSSSSGRQPY
ncbi:MAG: hypothetical protein M5R38_01900 [Candidatus Methylomirabilis sp.]|nr:hypothetical protein [Candidatus Methylomirabilis sp.]